MNAQFEIVDTGIFKRRLLFMGVVQWTKNERLIRRVMLGWLVGRIRHEADMKITWPNV